MEPTWTSRPISIGLAAILIVGLLSACAYRGSDNPVARKFSWFSYLDGEDIRAACGPGAPDRYRFVHNAINVEQVRTYEVDAIGAPQGHSLDVRILGTADLSNVILDRSFDLAGPWRGETSRVWLRDLDLGRLREAMAASDVFDGAPDGQRLNSYDFYWIVTGCREGRPFFAAFRWPSPAYEAAAFPNLLLAWDPTGVALNPPRVPELRDVYLNGDRPEEDTRMYSIQVGEEGLKGVVSLF